MAYTEELRRLRTLFRRKLDLLRAQEPEANRRAEVQRSEIVEELAGLLDEEEAVRLAMYELETYWYVDPVDGWVMTHNNTYFKGALFTDEEGYRKHRGLH